MHDKVAESTTPLAEKFAELLNDARRVKRASRQLARSSSAQRDDALARIADALEARAPEIIEANKEDLARAIELELSDAFIDRLVLNEARIAKMANAVREIIALPDPVGHVDEMWQRPNGLMVGKKRIPLGSIGIIYESRPNVTSDAAALCLKSGNGVLLKGGSDAFQTNRAIYDAMCEGLAASSLPPEASEAIGFVGTRDRDAVKYMLSLSDELDLIIPRGGKGLIRFVTEHSRIPVIAHDEGVCHVVVDGSARAAQVDEIVLNAKTQRPGVCNAAETLLLLESAVAPHLDRLLEVLVGAGVKVHLCPVSLARAEALDLPSFSYEPAGEEAWYAEYLALEIAIRVVPDLTSAIEHIETYGSDHTEAILTSDWDLGQRFVREVNSSVVVVNASTRFADGGQLGLGAEIGISTTRMHAYGPMGLRELTSTKFIVLGQGQVRDS